ncbi:MAG: polysaccharide ABC transporter ATP-binding protein [Candidatus Nanopelagicales bacterium]
MTQRFSLRHEKTLKGLLVNVVKGHPPNTDTFLALNDVNLTIPSGSTIGLIGHNGSGKSTLLKIIGGVLTPTYGQVLRRGRLAALLELGAGFHRDLSGRENVFLNAEILGLSRATITRKFDEIVEFSGVEQFIDTPMKYYSSGMFVRLGFSVAIHTDPDVLLVDEVLAVGDEQFQAKCLDVIRRMQNEGRTIVLVSHSMGQVSEFCDQVTLLHHGRVRAQGAPEQVIAAFRALTAKDAAKPRAGAGGSPGSADAGDSGAHATAVPTVAAVSCRTESGGPLADVKTGETLLLEATFAGVSGQRYVGRVDVYSGGQLIFGTSTDRLGLNPFNSAEQVTCRFRLPDLPLAGGRYRIAVSTAPDRNSAVLHTIPAAVEFAVQFTPTTSGPVAVSASAETFG